MNVATISDDGETVSIVLTSQALAAAGRGYADITLMQGSQILSTISFVLLIMAAPQIVDQVASSNEFNFLNEIIDDATHIIYEAEAWADGTRGGQNVYGENSFVYEKKSDIIRAVSIDATIFMQRVASTPGLKRVFTFSYRSDGSWSLVTTTYEGSTITTTTPEIINTLNDYGIVISLLMGADAPNVNDQIIVTVEEADNTFENNAKYYSEQARKSQQEIEGLSVSAESVPDIEHGGRAEVEKTIAEGEVHFHFKIPKGDVGDVNFMTFNIDIGNGELIMTKPDGMSPQVDFSVNNDDGNLYFEIDN